MKIPVVKNILEANERIALELKELFDEKGILVLNLMSSPGAGKTSLLEQTIEALKDKVRLAVVEGDIQTTIDAERIGKYGIPAVQINTYGACHIDGNMVKDALPALDLDTIDILIVENVGNLVCPAEFKVGEDHKVMILSVTEGEDKPAKYPLMFQESSVLLINKVDLVPYLECDVEKIKTEALKINPRLKVFPISCKTKEGLEAWFDWLLQTFQAKKKQA
ncbi:MAG: hydrogenase nickel incorporation protein HypB [Candidatus Desulfofervidaceae bacterium]|nr:hydrogenase nickel incorporation protein HypB [Candidatus Desulfofervidaceae bacterium]MDL1969409.1 hydrogenase nickel incorporation protein HypB [Candidatus Desulfofervidaceae bacterium]